MNRNREFDDLIHAIRSNAPQGLDTSVRRAMERAKRHRRNTNLFRIPAAAIVALVLTFTVLVNTSAAFARTVGEVPALKELAKLVARDPSLKAAVENKYVQPVRKTAVRNGLGITLYYVIADEQSLTAFFSIDQADMPGGDYYLWRGELLTMEDDHIDTMTAYPPETRSGGIQQIRFDFGKGEKLPGNVKLAFLLYRVSEGEPGWNHRYFQDPDCGERPPALPSEWKFELHLDLSLTAKGDKKPIGKWVELGGQRVYLSDLAIYPTQAKLNFKTDPDNTAVITDLRAWLENDAGEKWEEKDLFNSTTSHGGHEIVDFGMESPYFSEYDDLTLHIDQAALVLKDGIRITVDYANGTISPLPDHIKSLSMEPQGDELVLSFEIGLDEDYPFWYQTGEGQTIHYIPCDEYDLGRFTRVIKLGIADYDEPMTVLLTRAPREDIAPVAVEIK